MNQEVNGYSVSYELRTHPFPGQSIHTFQQQNKFSSTKEMRDRYQQKDLWPGADDDDFTPPSTQNFY